ncbi:MAG: polysaccharide deacetylase family protein [Fimbriimonadaceae bacterium]
MTPILCYHKIGPVAAEGRFLNVEPERLRSHIQFFLRRRYQIVMAKNVRDSWGARSVCLTFDDAYQSTLTFGLEVLESLSVKGSFYAVAGLMGKTSAWDVERARPLATQAELLAAHVSGHEIGSHSMSHPHLATLESDDQRRELSAAYIGLTELGFEQQSICYPYGSYNSETTSLAAELKYSIGLTLNRGVATAHSDPLALPRITVSCGDAIPLLLYKLYLRPKLPRRPKTVVQ